jgi:hypothetical protein
LDQEIRELQEIDQGIPLSDSLSLKTTPTSIVDQLLCRTSEGGPEEDEKECAVCLSRFEQGDLVRMLPSRHEFHADGIDKWLLEKDRSARAARWRARARATA